ncbi:MAG: hypothetical protein ACFFDT_31420 [Candidatus Hodarchaeota archaeon]
MTKQKTIKVIEKDFKSLFDDYEIWLEKLKEIEKVVTFLQVSFVGMLQERDKLFKK